MLFHCPHDCPCDHHGGGGGILVIFPSRYVASVAKCIPTRVDLQVSGNDPAEFSCDRGRKRRFDTVAAGVSPAISVGRFSSRHGFLCRFFIRRDFSRLFKLISKRWLASDNRPELLTNFHGIAHFGFPFADYPGE